MKIKDFCSGICLCSSFSVIVCFSLAVYSLFSETYSIEVLIYFFVSLILTFVWGVFFALNKLLKYAECDDVES